MAATTRNQQRPGVYVDGARVRKVEDADGCRTARGRAIQGAIVGEIADAGATCAQKDAVVILQIPGAARLILESSPVIAEETVSGAAAADRERAAGVVEQRAAINEGRGAGDGQSGVYVG